MREHLSLCLDCGRHLDEMVRIRDLVAALPDPEPSGVAIGRVLAQAREEAEKQRGFNGFRWWKAFAALSVIIIVGGLVTFQLKDRWLTESPSVASKQELSPAPSVAPALEAERPAEPEETEAVATAPAAPASSTVASVSVSQPAVPAPIDTNSLSTDARRPTPLGNQGTVISGHILVQEAEPFDMEQMSMAFEPAPLVAKAVSGALEEGPDQSGIMTASADRALSNDGLAAGARSSTDSLRKTESEKRAPRPGAGIAGSPTVAAGPTGYSVMADRALPAPSPKPSSAAPGRGTAPTAGLESDTRERSITLVPERRARDSERAETETSASADTRTETRDMTPAGGPSPDFLLDQANKALDDGYFNLAAHTYSRLLNQKPRNRTRIQALLGLAVSYEKQGRFDRARVVYRQLAQESPIHSDLARKKIQSLEKQ